MCGENPKNVKKCAVKLFFGEAALAEILFGETRSVKISCIETVFDEAS